MATNVYDSSTLSFYEPFGPSDIDMNSKSGNLYGYLSVKIQYVPDFSFFLCPSCKTLKNHTPIILLVNLEKVVLNSTNKKKKNLRMVLRAGGQVDSTTLNPSGEFYEHFMIDYSLISDVKNLTVTIYKGSKEIGKRVVHMKDLLEGNLLQEEYSNNKIAKAEFLMQLIYSCSDCIVERENESGNVDIPVLEVESFTPPAASASPSTVAASTLFPEVHVASASASASAMESVQLQGEQAIPGMTGFTAATRAQRSTPPVHEVVPQIMQIPVMEVQMAPQMMAPPQMMMAPPQMMMAPQMMGENGVYYQMTGYQGSQYGSVSGYAY